MILLNLRAPTIYMCFLSPSLTIFLLSVSSIRFLRLWNVLCHVQQLFTQFTLSNFHFILLKFNFNFRRISMNLFIQKSNVSLETLNFFSFFQKQGKEPEIKISELYGLRRQESKEPQSKLQHVKDQWRSHEILSCCVKIHVKELEKFLSVINSTFE